MHGDGGSTAAHQSSVKGFIVLGWSLLLAALCAALAVRHMLWRQHRLPHGSPAWEAADIESLRSELNGAADVTRSPTAGSTVSCDSSRSQRLAALLSSTSASGGGGRVVGLITLGGAETVGQANTQQALPCSHLAGHTATPLMGKVAAFRSPANSGRGAHAPLAGLHMGQLTESLRMPVEKLEVRARPHMGCVRASQVLMGVKCLLACLPVHPPARPSACRPACLPASLLPDELSSCPAAGLLAFCPACCVQSTVLRHPLSRLPDKHASLPALACAPAVHRGS